MEPDNNEAYIHNVCKKTAQLARVATDFNNSHIDQLQKIRELKKHYYKYFDSIIEQTRKNAQDVFGKLIQYRKMQIEDSCHEYGLQYKQIKSDFAHCLNDKSTQLNNISREAKQQNRNIKEMTRDSILLAKSVLSTADEVEKSLKAQARCISPNLTPEMRDRINDVKSKSEAEKKRSQAAISEMKQHYKDIAQDIKNQVRSIIFQEIRNRKGEFTELLNRTRTLKAETKEMKGRRKELIQEIKRQLIDAKEKRDSIVNSTKSEYKKIIDQTQRVSYDLKVENTQGSDKVNNAKQILRNARASQQKMINEINGLIEKQRNDSRDIEKSIAQRRKEKIEQLSREEANFMQQQKSEMQMKLEEIKIQQQIIEERKLTTDYLDDKSRELKNMFMNELTENQAKFSSNLRKMEFDVQTYFNERTNQYGQLNDDQISNLKDMFTDISDESRHNRKIVRKASHKVKKEIAESLEKNAEEIKQREANNEVEKAKFQEKLDAHTKERTDANEKRISVVVNSNTKKFQSIQSTFDADLEKKKNEIEKNRNIEEESYSLSDEETEFKHKRDKLEAELDYRVRAIDNANTLREKRLNECETTLVDLDKKKRMKERGFKTMSDNIIQEFEMQIQVAQVQLSDKIDKLSALFDKDENARAAVIIESIRKVKQTQNRLKDLTVKITEETEHKMKQIEQEKQKITTEINELNNGQAEEKLRQQLEKLENERNAEIEDMEKTTEKLKNEIIKAINKEKEAIEKAKQENSKQKEADDIEFDENSAHINEKNEKAAQEIEEKKQEIMEVINDKKAELEKDFDHDRQVLQARIDFAKQVYNEEKENCEKKLQEQKVKYKEEYEEKSDKLPTSAQNGINTLLKYNSQLHENIDELSKKLANLVYQYFTLDERFEEKKKKEELTKQSNALLSDIEETFKPLFGLRMRRINHPVFYKTVATNTDTDPIPPSALEMPRSPSLDPIAKTPTSGHRARASIVFPKSSRAYAENLV